MKTVICCLCVFLLSGCATFGKAFETQIVVTVSCDEVHSNSRWGIFGISSRIRDEDAKVIATATCKGKQ